MSGSRFVLPSQQPLQATGLPYAGGQLFFYLTGTSTLTPTYADSSLATPNSNPVVLDSAGNAGSVFLNPSIVYKVVLEDSDNNLIWTYDPVYPFADAGVAQNITFAGTSTGSANAQILNGLSSFTNGQIIEWTAGFTNTGAMTLSTFQMYQGGTGGPQVLTGGEVQVGTTYFSIFLSALNSNAGGFQLTSSNLSPTQLSGNNSTANANTAFVTAAIAAQAAKTPQRFVVTTGSGTYTTPAGATYLEVTDMLGAGSGGGASGTGSPGVGVAGGATTFGPLTANGGPATPGNTSVTYPTPATATGGDTNVPGGLGAGAGAVTGTTVNNPGSGASSPLGQGGMPTSVSGSGTVSASFATGYGAGGGAGGFGVGGSYNTGWGGNAGAYLKAIITSPAATYAYSIGVGGAGGIAGTNGSTGGAGAGGYIRVVAHFQ